MNDIVSLVQNNRRIKVVDSKNGNDITCSTLIQIVSEQHHAHNFSIMSEQFLIDIIKFSNSAYGDMFSEYIDAMLQYFNQSVKWMMDALNGITPFYFWNDNINLLNKYNSIFINSINDIMHKYYNFLNGAK